MTHVVISHWHGDHNFGVFRFAEEFPDVKFIAHEFTRFVMNSTRITYIDRQRNFAEKNLPEFDKIIKTGVDSDGNEHSATDREIYKRIIADADVISVEFNRAKVTPPDIVFTDTYTIETGDQDIELLYLGDANTAGDIVMWLPKEQVVATGDIIVLPSPYAFNVPPRAWVDTMRGLNDLNYKILVPGHGAVQTDTSYVDLVIEAAESIADQRDAMLAEGKSVDDVEAALDFSAFETGGIEALERLDRFRPQPTALIHSGGGLHSYWRLRTPLLPTTQTRAIIRALVRELGADPAATDLSRVLRVPGTWSWKRNAPVRLLRCTCSI